jgi:hypothetical protein
MCGWFETLPMVLPTPLDALRDATVEADATDALPLTDPK